MAKQLFNNPEGKRGSARVNLPMAEVYKIVKDRIENMCMGERSIDPDAVCQNVCVEIERANGTFPNVEGFVPSVERGGYQKPAINFVVAEDVRKFCAHVARHPENSNVADWYQELAVRSAIYPGKGTPFGLMYCALGLAEAGEVQNKAKKAFRDDGIIDFLTDDGTDLDGYMSVRIRPITPERRQQLIKELGGNLWYIAALCDEIGTTIGKVMATNLEEIASRSERGTLSGDGDNR